jgi:hypothetical protein
MFNNEIAVLRNLQFELPWFQIRDKAKKRKSENFSDQKKYNAPQIESCIYQIISNINNQYSDHDASFCKDDVRC